MLVEEAWDDQETWPYAACGYRRLVQLLQMHGISISQDLLQTPCETVAQALLHLSSALPRDDV